MIGQVFLVGDLGENIGLYAHILIDLNYGKSSTIQQITFKIYTNKYLYAKH